MAVRWRAAADAKLRKLLQNPSLSLSAFFAASYHTIQAIPRECTGSRVSTRDRVQGRIPAVVLSQLLLQKNPPGGLDTRLAGRKHIVTTEREQIHSILKSVELPFFCSTTFRLQIRAGSGSSVVLESGNVLPVKVHRDKETGKILNLVLVWADQGSELKVDVPVIFKGDDACPGLQKGGHLNKIRSNLKYLCPSEHIPQTIEVDISKLDIGDRIFMRDIEVHPSLKLVSKNDKIPICKIVATTNLEEEESPEAAAANNTKHDGSS